MGKKYTKPGLEELRKNLTPLQFEVTQNEATEPPFRNAFWNHHEAGIYVDIVTGEPLFSSLDQFDSGCGWPSFTRPIEESRITSRVDHRLRVERVEVRSRAGDSHLGHVFADGPGPTGLRYCINSAALRFIPLKQLKEEGYEEYVSLFEGAGGRVLETAVLAGGCFWGMEEILRQLPGVVETQVGYSGGTTAAPTYEQVKKGKTGHAEAIRIVFDPSELSFEELLGVFFKMHDPTTLNRQGNDLGSQYRSAIFFMSEEQERIARKVRDQVDQSGKWKNPVVTEIVPFQSFHDAEEYHQKYLLKNPGGYTCHWLRD